MAEKRRNRMVAFIMWSTLAVGALALPVHQREERSVPDGYAAPQNGSVDISPWQQHFIDNLPARFQEDPDSFEGLHPGLRPRDRSDEDEWQREIAEDRRRMEERRRNMPDMEERPYFPTAEEVAELRRRQELRGWTMPEIEMRDNPYEHLIRPNEREDETERQREIEEHRRRMEERHRNMPDIEERRGARDDWNRFDDSMDEPGYGYGNGESFDDGPTGYGAWGSSHTD